MTASGVDASVPVAPADWYADPTQRHQFRYWDGAVWTQHVADNGVASVDPLDRASEAVGGEPASRGCQVEFDGDGHVSSITAPEAAAWTASQGGSAAYYSLSADTLLDATEILKKLESIPAMTYYLVDTPDGSLGRDMNDYFTEAPLKTKDLKIGSPSARPGTVEFSSLRAFGDPFKNQSCVAQLKAAGRYSRLILLMECGRCGYQSPVETEAGPLARECYCCGAENTGERGSVNVVSGDGRFVEI